MCAAPSAPKSVELKWSEVMLSLALSPSATHMLPSAPNLFEERQRSVTDLLALIASPTCTIALPLRLFRLMSILVSVAFIFRPSATRIIPSSPNSLLARMSVESDLFSFSASPITRPPRTPMRLFARSDEVKDWFFLRPSARWTLASSVRPLHFNMRVLAVVHEVTNLQTIAAPEAFKRLSERRIISFESSPFSILIGRRVRRRSSARVVFVFRASAMLSPSSSLKSLSLRSMYVIVLFTLSASHMLSDPSSVCARLIDVIVLFNFSASLRWAPPFL
mmetsp:Transcript_49382/g.122707  ORF Transcript_49382/g.122707 Transcript_49382/m.122707 type:complete len:277 (+) Transcript_49382:1580-2410(+)